MVDGLYADSAFLLTIVTKTRIVEIVSVSEVFIFIESYKHRRAIPQNGN